MMMTQFIHLANKGGLFLEFGVASGNSIRGIAESIAPHPVFGFDSFDGLPEDWEANGLLCFGKGTFQCDPPTDLPSNVVLVKGMFQDTLDDFLMQHRDPVSFVHVDCDLYSSAKFVLMTLAPRLDGVIIVFDEILNHPVFEAHELRALEEFCQEARYGYEMLGQQHNCGAGYRMSAYGSGS